MRHAEFMNALSAEFGDLGPVLLADQALEALDGRTGSAALAAGVQPRVVWQALCEANDVPHSRRSGRRLRAPDRD